MSPNVTRDTVYNQIDFYISLIIWGDFDCGGDFNKCGGDFAVGRFDLHSLKHQFSLDNIFKVHRHDRKLNDNRNYSAIRATLQITG